MLLYNLIFGIHLYFSIKQATDAVAKRLTEQVWHYANEIDTYTRNLMIMAQSSARLLGRSEFTDHLDISGYLTDTLQQHPLAHGIKLFWFSTEDDRNHYHAHRQDGRIIIDRIDDPVLTAGQIWRFLQQEQGEGFWTDPRGQVIDGWLVGYVVPIYLGSLITGYLVLDFNLADLRKQVIDREVGQPKFSILNGLGQYVQTDSRTARQHNLQTIFESQRHYGTPQLWNDIATLIEDGKPAFRKIWVPMRQHEYWVVGAPIKSGRWWMITHIRRELALASVREQARVDALVMLLSLILIFTCAWIVSERISRPVSRLKQSMDDFTYRQIKPAIVNHSSDEIGSLTESFRQLVRKLDDREEALRDARANNIGHLVQRLRGNYFYFNLNREGCVTHVSPSVEAILGYQQADFLRPLSCFLNTETDQEKFHTQLRLALEGNWGDTFELDIRGKNNSVHRIEIFWSDMGDTSGRQSLIEGMANDITERKRIEEELTSARDEAEKANCAKGLFLSNMSHELRTPLNGVLGNAQLLMRNRSLSEQDRMILESIDVSGRHLLSLINDILDMTKIESSEIELNTVPTDLREILRDVQNILKEKAEGKGLALRLEVHSALPGVVMLDESKVRQVLLNLVSNAVKFTNRGWVKISVRVVKDALLLEVRDTGVGIPRKDLKRVFEPFRQVHAGMQMGGTGLGLAISRRLVLAMGGEALQVKSQEGRGSSFTFGLPLVDGSQSMLVDKLRLQGGTIHQELRDSDRGIPVLVVDDIESNRNMLAALLLSAGFNVSKAENGKQAIEAMHKHNYRLVLMDIRMPVMDGIDAIKKIRQTPAFSETRVIAVTASVSHKARERLLGQGFNDYLSKPLDAQQLFGAIAGLLGVSFEEASVAPVTDEESLLRGLAPEQCLELSRIISHGLELGDLEVLEQTLLSQKNISQKNEMLNYLLTITRDMKIEKLESLASRLFVKGKLTTVKYPDT